MAGVGWGLPVQPEHETGMWGSLERSGQLLQGHVSWSEGCVRGVGFVLSAPEAVESL